MRPTLTVEAFSQLLERFHPDRERAGEKYQELREVLIRFFEWRGAPYPEEHADETFDRVSRKLSPEVTITNIGGYCYEVARLVCLEALKRRGRSVQLDVAGVAAAEPSPDRGSETRLRCLETCLSRLTAEHRELIIEYYRGDGRARIERRRSLADRLGVERETLANRAQRVRNRLETCVMRCVQDRDDI